jgi:SpoVK/Ycf46/Vps4 family AAA+-type ATPase
MKMTIEIKLPKFALLTVLPNDDFKNDWEGLVGIDDLKKQLLTYLYISVVNLKVKLWWLKHYKKIGKLPVDFRGRILLIGPTGTGKTTLARGLADALSRKLNRRIYFVDLSVIRSKFIGVTSYNIMKLFEKVRELAEENVVVLFLDEFDTVASLRNFEQQHEEIRASVNTLIKELDKTKNKSVIIIAASNLEQHVDIAVKRRFDLIIRFNRPTRKQRFQLFKNFLSDFNFSEDDILKFAKRSKGFTQADIKRVIGGAISKAIREDRPLRSSDILQELRKTKPSGEYYD